VETVGDKYMAVSGLPDHCEDHAKCMARVALDMMDMAKNVKMGSNPVVSVEIHFIILQDVTLWIKPKVFNSIYSLEGFFLSFE